MGFLFFPISVWGSATKNLDVWTRLFETYSGTLISFFCFFCFSMDLACDTAHELAKMNPTNIFFKTGLKLVSNNWSWGGKTKRELEVIYQTWNVIYQTRIFDELRGIWKCGQTMSFCAWYISIETKIEKKMEN